MTPDAFISKWKAADLKERSAAQEHFIDLCRLLNEPTPAEADPNGESYCFERGATKTNGGQGWADVWKRGHFGWEYKGRGKDLNSAFAQLQQYAIALENPPLLVVCDLDRFRFHTNWNNTVSVVHDLALDDLRDAAARQKLKAVFSDPEKLRPGRTRQALTEDAAADFAQLAQRLRERGHAAEPVAHFINRLVFCMFAEDIGLLPGKMFSRMLDHAKTRPDHFAGMAKSLFGAMKSGGMVGFEPVDWFNGGLFDDDTALPLDKEDIKLAARVADLDWAEIDPTLFGTLFERGLDPDKRSQLGAHYTDRDKIMLIIEPVIVRPLLAEWRTVKQTIEEALQRAKATKASSARTKAENSALAHYRAFLDRLRSFTVLDPACGSGNFLYLALLALKDLEHRVMIEAEALGFQREFPQIGPASVKGIEINAYAAELARVTIWIGEIQWMRRNGFDVSKNPILKPLETIECRDALLNADGTEANWPEANAIIGNPPFLGSRRLVPELGSGYVAKLRHAYRDRVPRGADFVCFWFAKAWEAIQVGSASYAGLVATNSISGGASRKVLEPISHARGLYQVWRDEPWTVEGAAVRVAVICFSNVPSEKPLLDGREVSLIEADLRTPVASSTLSFGLAHRLTENEGIAFQGVVPRSSVNKATATRLGLPGASFVLSGDKARELLARPLNPNGRPNSDVIVPFLVGDDIASRPMDRFIVDFGNMSEQAAALYEEPFAAIGPVRLHRAAMTQPEALATWWQHWRSRPDLRSAVLPLERYIATPRVSKYRLFAWSNHPTLPDNAVVVIARDDDVTFGILQSTFHESWSLRMCTYLGVGNDPRYTPTTCFSTFPFPEGITLDMPASAYASDPRAIRIAAAAKRLDGLRSNWLNPADLVKAEPEPVPGFPARIVPIDEKAAATLKKRTLTNLYNERPTWLINAHADLDRAVAAAYGWPEDISNEDALTRLLSLNQARATGQNATGPALEEDEREVA